MCTASSTRRPRSVLATASGSSAISFAMKRRPAALLGGGGVPGDLERLDLDRRAGEVGHRDAVGRDGDDLVLADRDGAAGVLDERGDVGAEEVLAVAQPDHERGVAARADDDVRLVLVHREQREGALEARDDRPGTPAGRSPVRRYSRPSSTAATSVSVSRLEGESVGEQLVLQRREVLDDAVVDDGEPAVVAQVRVRVDVGRAAVRRPAGVADAGLTVRDGVLLQVLGRARRACPPSCACRARRPGRSRRCRRSRSRGTPGASARRAAPRGSCRYRRTPRFHTWARFYRGLDRAPRL